MGCPAVLSRKWQRGQQRLKGPKGQGWGRVCCRGQANPFLLPPLQRAFLPSATPPPLHRHTLAGLGWGVKSGDAPFSPSLQCQEVQLVMSPETQELVEKQQTVRVLLQAERVPTNSYVGALSCECDCRIVTLFGRWGSLQT